MTSYDSIVVFIPFFVRPTVITKRYRHEIDVVIDSKSYYSILTTSTAYLPNEVIHSISQPAVHIVFHRSVGLHTIVNI